MRVAYRDEFPWARCDCGWTNHQTGQCPGCGKDEPAEMLDRFALNVGGTTTDGMGAEYRVVPYEDRLRKFPVA